MHYYISLRHVEVFTGCSILKSLKISRSSPKVIFWNNFVKPECVWKALEIQFCSSKNFAFISIFTILHFLHFSNGTPCNAEKICGPKEVSFCNKGKPGTCSHFILCKTQHFNCNWPCKVTTRILALNT